MSTFIFKGVILLFQEHKYTEEVNFSCLIADLTKYEHSRMTIKVIIKMTRCYFYFLEIMFYFYSSSKDNNNNNNNNKNTSSKNSNQQKQFYIDGTQEMWTNLCSSSKPLPVACQKLHQAWQKLCNEQRRKSLIPSVFTHIALVEFFFGFAFL